MRVDAMLQADLGSVAAEARTHEADGYSATWCGETAHDAFVMSTLAAAATTRIEIGTGVAIALARNPLTLATLGNDLQTVASGRFLLGLGSQVKPHIERRFSMQWSRPVARMRELVLAMRAIWRAWSDGSRLEFEGEFFTHTLMTPKFDPGPNPFGNPPIYLAAVGERMATVAGEVGDGLLLHSFVTEQYLRTVTLDALERGIAASGRQRSDLRISYPAFVVVGDTEQEIERASARVREQIAFYGSTPSYLPVLALHGWGDLHTELHSLSRLREWDAMTGLVDEDVLHAFAAVGTPRDVARQLTERVGDLVDRVTPYAPYELAPEAASELADELRRAAAPVV